MKTEPRFEDDINHLLPALREAAEAKGMNLSKLTVGIPMANDRWAGTDPHLVKVSDGKDVVDWRATSLSELYRGDFQPPANIDRYPPEYTPLFAFIELQIITFCDAFGDKSDQEFVEVYTQLHRRAEGRSLGPLHDFTWQVAALMLATRIVSQAEFVAVIGALLKSARRWALRPISRNYISYLRETLGKAAS